MSMRPPVTHFFNFGQVDDKMRPYIMAEYAANGGKNLVLTDALIRDVMRQPRYAKVLIADGTSAGVKFVDAHAPFGIGEDLNLPFENARHAMLMRFKLAFEISADLGLESITCHVGNTPPEYAEYSLEHLHACAIRSLEELLPTAERLGLTIAIENIWSPTNTPEKLVAIINHFKSDNLGLCYDAGHANLMAKDCGAEDSRPIRAWKDFGPIPYDAHILEKMLPHVTTCHLQDNHGLQDEHLLPGRGTVVWPHVIDLLKTAPRLKCFQNESSPVGSGASIADTCRTFRELLGSTAAG